MKALLTFFSILLNLSSYGYSKTTISTIIFFSALGSNSVLKLKAAKIPKIMLWVILSLSTENGPRAEKNIFVDKVVSKYP